jgi:hypothetical protein
VTTNFTLALNQSNDETIILTLTESDTGEPYPLAGAAVEFLIKTSSATADSDPSTVVLSTTGGEVVIVDEATGECQVNVPASALPTPGPFWWRVDVLGSGGSPRKTGGCGNLNINPM